MQTLCTGSFTNIEQLIPDNYGSVHSRLRLILKDDSELFAGIDFFPNKGQWTTPIDGTMHRYGEASAEKKEQIRYQILEKKEQFMPKLKKQFAYADDLFYVPNEEQIFWTEDGGQLKVVLAQWGFKEIMKPKDGGVIELMAAKPFEYLQTEVRIHVRYSDGAPVAEQTLNIEALSNQFSCQTDAEGNVDLGKMFAGREVKVDLADGSASTTFKVEKGREGYEIVLDRKTSYTVQVVDQDNKPMADYPVTIDGRDYTTDANGEVSESVVLLPDHKISVSAQYGEPTDYTLVADAEQNRFTYRITIPVEPEKPEEPEPPFVPEPEPKMITIRLLDYDGTPLYDMPFTIEIEKGVKVSGVTDSDGRAKVEAKHFINNKKPKIDFTVTTEYRNNKPLQTNKKK